MSSLSQGVLRAYVSGALTGASPADAHQLYDAVGEALRSHAFVAYLPHLATDPSVHPNIPADAVYLRDRTEVATADLVVAFIGRPSLGVGMELELAAAALVPVLLLAQTGSLISRMALGGIGRVFGPVPFTDAASLGAALASQLPTIALELRRHPRVPVLDIAGTFRRLRTNANLTQLEAARGLGVSVQLIELVETAPAVVSNPSLAFLASASHLFGVQIETLVAGRGDPIALASLRLFALERGLSFNEYNDLERRITAMPLGGASLNTRMLDQLREEQALARAGLRQLKLLSDA